MEDYKLKLLFNENESDVITVDESIFQSFSGKLSEESEFIKRETGTTILIKQSFFAENKKVPNVGDMY